MVQSKRDELVQELFNNRTPLFEAHRWRGYEVNDTIVLIAFNGSLGHERDDYLGWEYGHTVRDLSAAVRMIIQIYAGY